MADKKVTGGRIGDQLVGFQFTVNSTLFTNATFETLPAAVSYEENMQAGDGYEIFTLDEVDVKKEKQLLYDRHSINGDLGKHVYFGSLYKQLGAAINKIITGFPGSIFIHPGTSNEATSLGLSTTFQDGGYVQSFSIPLGRLINKSGERHPFSEGDITLYPHNFELFTEGKYYRVISTALVDGVLALEVKGLPIKSSTQVFHIVRERQLARGIIFNMGGIENHILSRHTAEGYLFPFRFEEEGRLIEKVFTWPSIDGYNPDIQTRPFYNLVENLFRFAEQYDKHAQRLNHYKPHLEEDGDATETYFNVQARFLDELMYLAHTKLGGREDMVHSPASLLEVFNNQGWVGMVFLEKFLNSLDINSQLNFVKVLAQHQPYLKQYKASRRAVEELLALGGFTNIYKLDEVILQDTVEVVDNHKSWPGGVSLHEDPFTGTYYGASPFSHTKKLYLRYTGDDSVGFLLWVNPGLTEAEGRIFMRTYFILLHETLFPFVKMNLLPETADVQNTFLINFETINNNDGTISIKWATDNRFIDSVEIERSVKKSFPEASTTLLGIGVSPFVDTYPVGIKEVYYRVRGTFFTGEKQSWVYKTVKLV